MAADPKIVLGSHSHMSCRSRVATWPPARPTTPSMPSSSARLLHEIVLDTIAPLSPRTPPCSATLRSDVEDKIVFTLRDRRDQTADTGVWLATTEEPHQSLRREFLNMRSIQVLGKKVTGWQILPTDAEDFEEAALRAYELVLARDPRIGKVPAQRARSADKKGSESLEARKNDEEGRKRSRQVVSRVRS